MNKRFLTILIALSCALLLFGCTQISTTPTKDTNTKKGNTDLNTPASTNPGTTSPPAQTAITITNGCTYFTETLVSQYLIQTYMQIHPDLNDPNCMYIGTTSPPTDTNVKINNYVAFFSLIPIVPNDVLTPNAHYDEQKIALAGTDIAGIGDKAFSSAGLFGIPTATIEFMKNGQTYQVGVTDSLSSQDNLTKATAIAKAIAPKLP